MGWTQRLPSLALVLRELNQSRLFILSCHSVVCLYKKGRVFYLIISGCEKKQGKLDGDFLNDGYIIHGQERIKESLSSIVFTISSDCNGNHKTPGNIALPPPQAVNSKDTIQLP